MANGFEDGLATVKQHKYTMKKQELERFAIIGKP